MRKTDEDIIIGDNSKLKEEFEWESTQSIEDVLQEMFEYWMNYSKNKVS